MPAIHPPPALEPGLPRRAVLRAWACVVLAAALPAAQAGEETMMEFTYSIGVNTVPGTALIDATAKDLDLWRKHGLKPVTPPPLGGGDRRAWSPEEENHSDVRLYGMGATINYISKGVEFVIVADLGTAEKLLATITLNPSGKINQATIEKMRDHYVETGVIPASSPPADSMYTARWVGRRD